MDVLITSKTHMGNAACVGGLVLATNQFVRLLNEGNWNQYADTDLNVGDVWDIDFYERKDLVPPHVEDVIIRARGYKRSINDLSTFLQGLDVEIFNGHPNQIFNGKVRWTSKGSGYIGDRNNLPAHSVGFWICDKDLTLDDDNEHYKYPEANPFLPQKRFKHVGFETKLKVIPQGTLLRISLARWWSPENVDINKRCYLQLSGWYTQGMSETPDNSTDSFFDEFDDLPF